MLTATVARFEEAELASKLCEMTQEELDRLEFGVIAFDATTKVCRYNAYESKAAGLRPASVVGLPLFDTVAPCMNNFMIAQRFEDAMATSSKLDAIIDYVLTLRMRPVKVKLRLLAAPDSRTPRPRISR